MIRILAGVCFLIFPRQPNRTLLCCGPKTRLVFLLFFIFGKLDFLNAIWPTVHGEIYREKKINPAAGCLPILIQIPIFFALYKVLFVSIEMRHAPFFGWIKDLSAPDPTSLFNLFGLVPWDPPLFLTIGIWPLLMGLTMFLQQKINPPPPDPIQAKIFAWMPVAFTFLLATFPAGLVIYWTWNNLLSIAQQWVIMNGMKKDSK